MAKEYALNLKRENHQRKQRRKARSNMMGKPDISKVIPSLARQALLLAGGDRKAAYSRYIQLYFRQTGRLAPGCDNRDLQAFYDSKEVEHDA